MCPSRREKELKYEIKTANFVAEIENDEQLTQLAKVGTIQKNTKLRMLPNGQWMPAKTLPLLQVVWGLVPAANIPAIERPQDAGTGIKRLLKAPPVPKTSGGSDVPPPPPSHAPHVSTHAPELPPPAPVLPPSAPRHAPELPPPAPVLPPPAPKLPPSSMASLMSGPPSLETVVDRVPRYFPQEEEKEEARIEPKAFVKSEPEPKPKTESSYDDDEARKLAEAMKSHDLEVLDSLDIEVLTPSVDLDKDVVFLSDHADEKPAPAPKASSPVALESTLLLTDDIVKETLLPSRDVRSKSEIVEADHLYMDEDESRTHTNWEDDLADVGDETVATMRNPFMNGAPDDEDGESIDISLEDNPESDANDTRERGLDHLHSSTGGDVAKADVPLVAQRAPTGNRARIRKNSRMQQAVMEDIESAQTRDAFAIAEERTTHDVKLLDFFMEKAQTKPVIPPSELAEAFYEEEETRERSHVDEARLQSLVNAVSSSSKAVAPTENSQRISSVLDDEEETRTRNGSEAAFISAKNDPKPSEAPMRTLSPADLNAARAAIELAQKKLDQAEKLDVHELREAANLVSSTFDAIVHSQINAVIEDNEHSSIRMYSKNTPEPPLKDANQKAISAEGGTYTPEAISQVAKERRNDAKVTQNDDASDEFDESVSEQFTIHSRDELEAMMRAFRVQEKKIQHLSGETETVSADEEIDDEPSSSDKLRIHKRLDLGRLDLGNLDESDSVSINIPLANTRSIPPVQTGELRSLFEKEDELHILLANEIRTVESNCNKEAMKDEAINVRPKPGESNLNGNEPSEESSMKMEDTVQTSLPESSKTTENLIAQLLHNGEKQIARYGSFVLTNRNIWYIEKSPFGLKNYESYDLKTVQSFALRQEHNWGLIIIDLLVIIAALIVGFVFYDEQNAIFYGSIFLGGWAVLMLVVLYLVGYRTTLQIGVGTTVMKSRESVPRGEHLEAAKFLERLDRERVRVQKHARKGK